MSGVTERLEDVMQRLEACSKEYLRLAVEHHHDLLLNRTQEMRRGVEAMEALLERIREFETVRIDTCNELADIKGLPWSGTAWKLEDLIPHLEVGLAIRLKEMGNRLKANLVEATGVAKQNAFLAEAGHRIANASLSGISKMAIGHQRAPSAYGRRGAVNLRPAVPVLNSSEWRG